MNLETIEENSLNYLSQVSNPLVRIEVLYAHLRDRELVGDMDVARLKSFLERHALFRVMQPATGGPEVSPTDPGAAYVILATRAPSHAQISEMMRGQLLALEQALITARAEALELDDPPRVGTIEEALHRLSALRKKLDAPPDSTSSN